MQYCNNSMLRLRGFLKKYIWDYLGVFPKWQTPPLWEASVQFFLFVSENMKISDVIMNPILMYFKIILNGPCFSSELTQLK